MATKTWKIDNLTRDLSDGYVSQAYYTVEGVDGDHTYSWSEGIDLPKPSSLVAYNSLSEATVIGWVKARIDETATGTLTDGVTSDDFAPTVAQIESAVDAQVAEKKNPTRGDGVPW